MVRPEAYLIPLYVTIQSVFENVNGTATGNVHGQIHNSLTEKILHNVQSTEPLVMSNCCERQPQSYSVHCTRPLLLLEIILDGFSWSC